MKFMTKLSWFSIILLLLGCMENPSPKEADFKTTIIHINDHHSHIEADTIPLQIEGQTIKAHVGGFSQVVSQIKKIQKSSINPITLHAGDALQGTIYYTLFKGEVDAKVMNQIKWDAFTLGNHEFDDGDERLAAFLDQLQAPILSANVVAHSPSPLYRKWEPYRIIERSAEKIAIIGLDVSFKTKHSSRPSSSIDFLDEINTVKRYVKEIEDLGINKIILLSHFGFKNDQQLAKAVQGIDLIIDGDSHTLLGDFAMVGLKSQGSYPTLVHSKNNQPVCIAQAWNYSYVVGKLHVAFDQEGVITSCQGTPTLLLSPTNDPKLIALANQYPQLAIVEPDIQTSQTIQHYQAKLASQKRQIVAQSKSYIGHNRIPRDKADGISTLPYGSDIAPLIAKSFYLKSTRADCAIQNAGGVRTGLKKGNISIDDIYKLLPFSNTLIELTISGAQIKAVLEDALNAVLESHSTGAFPYGYALRYAIDTTQPKGQRIRHIEILDKKSQTFLPLELSKNYVVVSNSYIAAGRDGYTTFKDISKRVDTYYDYAMSFGDMLKRLKILTPLNRKYHPIKSFK